MSEQIPDPTPEDADYYHLCAESAWNDYQATGDERYALICIAYFTRYMILSERLARDER